MILPIMRDITMSIDRDSAQVGEIDEYTLMAGMNKCSVEALQLSEGEMSEIPFDRESKRIKYVPHPTRAPSSNFPIIRMLYSEDCHPSY
jgi:hypothetical protein